MASGVMLIDDEEVLHRLIRRVLDRVGVELVAYTEPLEAVEFLASAAAEELPALVLLDIRMPSVDGHSTLRLIRGQGPGGCVPVFALSGSVQPEDRAEAWENGVSAYLRKPDDLEGFTDLAEFIRRYLDLNHPANQEHLGS